MHICICGGRKLDITDDRYYDVLSNIYWTLLELKEAKGGGEDVLVTGCAKGGDRIGELWCTRYNFKLREFPADWDKYGKSAGPIRNFEMAKYLADNRPSIVIALPGGKGTAHMESLTTRFQLPLIKVLDIDYIDWIRVG